MDTSAVSRRVLTALATATLAVGMVTTFGSPARAAETCPTVGPTGIVTPAPAPGVDWSGCGLAGANLSSADLTGANLSRTNLLHANLSSADLTSANLGSAYLDRTTLTGATLTGAAMTSSRLYLVVSGQITTTPAGLPANWTQAGGYLIGPDDNLESASLAGVSLQGADLESALITYADLSGADLSNADLTNADLESSDLAGADLTGANLETFYLTDLTLTGANLSGAKFAYDGDLTGVISGGITGKPASLPYYPSGAYVLAGGYLAGPGADLANADLAGLNLTGAALVENADLSGADLTGANLSNAFIGADLADAKLAGANLTDLSSYLNSGTPVSVPPHWSFVGGYLFGPTVDVIGQDISGFDLAGLDLAGGQFNDSNLTGANLSGTDLSQTYLWYANLKSATVTGADFAGASWSYTTCPDGTDSNLYVDGCFSARDHTRPVLHLNVRNGQVLAVGSAPKVACTVTDKYSPVEMNPTLKITGRSSHGLGKFTATCSGVTDLAGNAARPVTATYWIVYDFDGMQPQQGATVPTSGRELTVTFGLSGAAGSISKATALAMVRRHDVRVTLRGPGIKATTALCRSYSVDAGFICRLRLPHVRTGRGHRYTLTAYENDGFGLVIAPGEPTAENPVAIHFR